MDKHEHAALLKQAIAEAGVDREALAKEVGRTYRTVSNWVSESSPTMPSAAERAVLRRILGPYDMAGDAVEKALLRSDLQEWRQAVVLAEYKKQRHQQSQEELSEGRPNLSLVAKEGDIQGSGEFNT